jgi:Sec-independent protein translocase protein TatA
MKNKNIIIFLILLIILVIFCIIFLVLFNNKSEGIGRAGISLEEFKRISNGMTQSEVENIIDSDDLWDDDNVYAKACIKLKESKNNSIYKYEYKYLGDKSGYAIVTYEVDYSNGFNGLKYPIVVELQNYDLK